MQYTETRLRLRPHTAVAQSSVKWLPLLSVVAAFGILFVSFADTAARTDEPWAQPLLWVSLIIVFVPIALRLVLGSVSRAEAIMLIAYLGLTVYAVKLLHSPLYFMFFDEFLHWRTASDILTTGHLFTPNSLLPVSPLYPGLEIVTSAIASMSGLSIFLSGLIVVGVARLLMVVGLFLFFERISQSVRIASISAMLYMTNPKFVFFDAQFAYESLALPLAVFVLVAIIHRQQSSAAERRSIGLLAALGILALTVTHHGTALMFTAFLVGWAVLARVKRWGLERQDGPGWLALLAISTNLIWLFGVASITFAYFAPHIVHTFEAVSAMFAKAAPGRQLYASATGRVAPLLERLTGMAAAMIPMPAMFYGLWVIWKRHRSNPTIIFLGAGALLFPVCILLRLTGGGWEIGARLAAFAYLPLGFVMALAVEHFRERFKRPWLLRVAAVCCIPILFAGGVIAGWSPWTRMPWPFWVIADSRSVEAQGIAAADWAREHLGTDNRMVADRTNMTLMGSYGKQRMVTNLTDKVSVSGIFLSPWFGKSELKVLHDASIRYVVVDQRVTNGLPLEGYYYEEWEQLVVRFTPPVQPVVFEKFDNTENVNRVFDGGVIHLYDVGSIDHE